MAQEYTMEDVVLTFTKQEYEELLSTLKKAEEICDSMRHQGLDFRMQRHRLERKRRESIAPEAETRFVPIEEDLGGRRG